MSIMPAGGWNAPREGQIAHDTPKPTPSVVFVHTQVKRASAFSSGFGGCLGVICAVVFATVALVVVVDILNAPPAPRRAAEAGFAALSEPAAAPVIYSVAQVNAHMNNIPTGTDLAVRGIYYSPHVSGGWAPPNQLDPCSVLLYGGTVKVQHGEADPRDYCRFSVVLQDENTSQIQYLECAMSLEEAQAAKGLYSYKSLVQAHGTYASSLDFHIMPAFLGQQVGVPVLDDCALEPSSPLPVPTVPAPAAEQPAEEQNQNSGAQMPSPEAQSQPKVTQSATGPTQGQSNKIPAGAPPDEVAAILGPPISVTTGAKHVFHYPHLDVIFVDGKVSEIQRF